MNRRPDYDRVDWTKSDVAIAESLGVTKQAIQAARKSRGIPSIVGHGGYRKGSGHGPANPNLRRPKAARKDYENVDWRQSNAEIAKELGVTREAVNEARKRRGMPRFGVRLGDVKAYADFRGVSYGTASRHKRKNHPEWVKYIAKVTKNRNDSEPI